MNNQEKLDAIKKQIYTRNFYEGSDWLEHYSFILQYIENILNDKA